MNILAFDTSSTACSVGLWINNAMITSHKIVPMQQAQCILPMIDELIKNQNILLKELNAIAFGCGPGSFTGIRIATSVAQALGYALNIPLLPISSLAALAQTAYNNQGWKKQIVAIDARIQEVYWGCYQVNQSGLMELVEEEQVGAPESITLNYLKELSDSRNEEEFKNSKKSIIDSKKVENFSSTNWYGVGNAWEIYDKQIALHPADINTCYLPTAESIIQLAIPQLESHHGLKPDEVLPVYLRNQVATKEKKR